MGDVLAVCRAPRAKVSVGRAERARPTWARPRSSRSVVCCMKFTRFFCALFTNDAHERHGRHLLLYRLPGAARGIIRRRTTSRSAMHPRAILLVRARRSSRGSVRVRAAERALLPRERGHPARGRAPGAPGNLSLRAPARDARQDAVGPCWRRRAAAAAPGRGARRRSEGRRQQVGCCFYLFFSCWGEGCVDRHSEEREREGEENTIGNPFLICMNERGHHAHELCPPKTSHGGHEAPHQNLIEFHFFAFFSSTKCVADEQQVGEKYRPVARARARRRALYALEAARDDRRVPERRGFRQRDARRGDDSHVRHANRFCRGCASKTGP